MAEISQGKKYGHEINFHGPYLDGQINLNFHVVSSSEDQIKTIKEIADLIREDGTIPATGNYTYYEKQEEKKEVEKKEELEVAKDEAPVATPRLIMKTVIGIQVDGDGIKPIFAKEENRVESRVMTMSLESVSASDDETIYPTILSAEAPSVLADSSDDSKLITYGNLKAFAGLTDGRYIKKGTLDTIYRYNVQLNVSQIKIPFSGGTYSVSGIVTCVYYTSASTYHASDVSSGSGYFYSYNGGSPVGGIITRIYHSRLN